MHHSMKTVLYFVTHILTIFLQVREASQTEMQKLDSLIGNSVNLLQGSKMRRVNLNVSSLKITQNLI